MPRSRDELLDHSRIHRCPVGGDLNRSGTESHRASEEGPRGPGVATRCDQDVDDLTVLIDRPIQVGPAAGDLDVGLIDEPPIPRRTPRMSGGVDELRA
jgi:hypothetical protein